MRPLPPFEVPVAWDNRTVRRKARKECISDDERHKPSQSGEDGSRGADSTRRLELRLGAGES